MYACISIISIYMLLQSFFKSPGGKQGNALQWAGDLINLATSAEKLWEEGVVDPQELSQSTSGVSMVYYSIVQYSIENME